MKKKRQRPYRQPLGSWHCAAKALAISAVAKEYWKRHRAHVPPRTGETEYGDLEVQIVNILQQLRKGTHPSLKLLTPECRKSKNPKECTCTKICIRCSCDACKASPSGGLFSKKKMNLVFHHGRFEITGPQSTVPCAAGISCRACNDTRARRKMMGGAQTNPGFEVLRAMPPGYPSASGVFVGASAARASILPPNTAAAATVASLSAGGQTATNMLPCVPVSMMPSASSRGGHSPPFTAPSKSSSDSFSSEFWPSQQAPLGPPKQTKMPNAAGAAGAAGPPRLILVGAQQMEQQMQQQIQAQIQQQVQLQVQRQMQMPLRLSSQGMPRWSSASPNFDLAAQRYFYGQMSSSTGQRRALQPTPFATQLRPPSKSTSSLSASSSSLAAPTESQPSKSTKVAVPDSNVAQRSEQIATATATGAGDGSAKEARPEAQSTEKPSAPGVPMPTSTMGSVSTTTVKNAGTSLAAQPSPAVMMSGRFSQPKPLALSSNPILGAMPYSSSSGFNPYVEARTANLWMTLGRMKQVVQQLRRTGSRNDLVAELDQGLDTIKRIMSSHSSFTSTGAGREQSLMEYPPRV